MRVGIKSGTFSILHQGHIWSLEQAKKRCDHLVVLLNDDDYLLEKKGIITIDLAGRMSIISSIRFVDEVDYFSGPNEDEWIKRFSEEKLKQDYGEDATLTIFHSIETKGKSFIPGSKYADEIVFLPRIKGSTTEIFEKIRNG